MRKKLVGALLCASMTAGLLAGTTTVFAGASKALEAGNVYCPWNLRNRDAVLSPGRTGFKHNPSECGYSSSRASGEIK